jgi:uncharacterized membrane protein
MTTHDIRVGERDSLARFLGWFSVGLGAAQLSAPRLLCRAIGAESHGAAPRVMRLMGARELGHGIGILTRPQPTRWVWSRVVGDALDVAALAAVAVRNPRRRLRAGFGIVNVGAVAVADAYEARYLSQHPAEPRRGMRIQKAVTIAKPLDEVQQAWANADDLRRKVGERGARVSFVEASGGRGVELAVEFTFKPPAGDFGAVVERVAGRDLATQLADDLRRLKSELETGEVVRSDSTLQGHLLRRHLRQRPARPLAGIRA